MQNITFEENLLIKSEVASSMKSSVHNAARVLKAYFFLKYKPKELQQYYYEAFSEYISENDLNMVIAEVSLNEHSFTLWINSILEDIQYYLKPNKEYDFNNKQAYIDETRYAFYCFVDIVFSLNQDAAVQLLRAVLDDYRCEFLNQVAFVRLTEYLNAEIDEPNDLETKKMQEVKEEHYKHILAFSFQPRAVIEAIRYQNYQEDNQLSEEKTEEEECFSEIKQKKSTHEVQKILKENNKIISSRKFASKAEAKEFLENMQKEYPDLFRIFDFKIVKI